MQQDLMINHVKCCTEIEQHEQRDTAVVDWADQIVMNNEHYSLWSGRVTGWIVGIATWLVKCLATRRSSRQ